mgnify:CR=1 FL=1
MHPTQAAEGIGVQEPERVRPEEHPAEEPTRKESRFLRARAGLRRHETQRIAPVEPGARPARE